MDGSSRRTLGLLLVTVAALYLQPLLRGGEEASAGNKNASKGGKLEVDPPTLHCLGVMWLIEGDANKNAVITLEYREAGKGDWKESLPLVRALDGGAPKGIASPNSYFFKVNVPPGTWRFAGSTFDLKPETEYELRVKLKDPDGGDEEKIVTGRTRGVPPRSGDGKSLYVVPAAEGQAGGDGSEKSPFVGLAAAVAAAKPGDTVWLKPGRYKEALKPALDGQPGKPIFFRGAPGGEAVLEGAGIQANGRKFLSFDSLSVVNTGNAVSAENASDIWVRWCKFENVVSGVHARDARNFYLADCEMSGKSTWPRTKGIEPTAGFDIGGQGHVICYNRVRGVADGISCLRGALNRALDFYGNEVTECTDDGIETDYADWNLRCFRNRLTNIFQGISVQPVKGGPVFVIRNVLYNIQVETFKLHNYGSGVIFLHNTTVKTGVPIMVSTPEAATNMRFFNNLFVGAKDGSAMNFGVSMVECEFDYNGLAGDNPKPVYRWNRKNLPPLEELNKSGPIQQHGLWFNTSETKLFAAEVKPPEDVKTQYPISVNDLRLKEGCPALDAGVKLPGINDGFKGKGPDLGAYEFGEEMPHYGPRPDPEKAKEKAPGKP